jgi:hypothetical protein
MCALHDRIISQTIRGCGFTQCRIYRADRACYKSSLGFLTDIRISAHTALSADTKLTLFLYATDGSTYCTSSQTTKTVALLPISVNKCRDDGEAALGCAGLN